MISIRDIEQAVSELPPADLAAFREWFAEYDAARWDEQFERDASNGRLDALAREAIDDLKNGRCKDL